VNVSHAKTAREDYVKRLVFEILREVNQKGSVEWDQLLGHLAALCGLLFAACDHIFYLISVWKEVSKICSIGSAKASSSTIWRHAPLRRDSIESQDTLENPS
jgi:hypothetical protein